MLIAAGAALAEAEEAAEETAEAVRYDA
jgi:hypothetical protein